MEDMKQTPLTQHTGGHIPDRVSIEVDSPFYWGRVRKLGVRVDGVKRNRDVVEFCVSDGWVRVQAKDKFGRKLVDPNDPGRYLLAKIEGVVVEPYWIDDELKEAGPADAARLSAAEAKRQRKAAALAARGRL